ncbi:hypothetical protein J2848_005320 [Azospirillum lipoferum]|uniref:Uncharacterized protein n=1 Tax=Azospirillum lipoferum TaxID=193 RepID=A0A5A9GFR6_AZOLI|nr:MULTISPECIES: hypothetical protein [Azospirillum]KAA0593213.1 hypothetical protein FZ942_25090 [Azospirillum lipoferum]MCP1613624.1 hypothetical protein [Azospirillum lipoferum]MDW5532386.1 hypothetical protein [Azospirillum sp. NL1]
MTGRATEGGKTDHLPGLESRLFDIPEDKFIEVVRLLERVRDHPDVRQTFAAIRPRLVQVRPNRRPTLKRVLCMPFEDVLESFSGVDVPLGRIERRVIDPVWRLVTECGDTALIDQLDRQAQETAPGNLNALRNIGRRLWPMAAKAIRGAVEQDSGRQALRRVLHGDDEMQRQVLDVAAFLEIGLTVESLKDALAPKPLPALDDRHVDAIEQAAQAVARQSSGLVYYLLLVAASRMENPADLLTVVNDLDFGKARREQPVIFAQLSGLVVTNLEERSARLDGHGYSAGPDRAAVAVAPEEAVAIAERLVASVDTTSAVMDFLADPVYRGRLDAVKVAVRTMVAGTVLDTASAGILTAVPAPAGSGRPIPVNEDAQEAAEDHARALRRCEGLAEALGLQEPLKDAMASMEKGLLARAHALLAQYPKAADPEDAETAEINLFYALRLLELVAGPAKADQFRTAIMAATGEFAEEE